MAGKYYKGYTEARNKASQKYNKEHLEQIAIRVKKGDRARYKALADRRGESLAGLICRLLDSEDEKDRPDGIQLSEDDDTSI